MKLLVLGATGMLGNAVLRFFADSPGYVVSGTARTSSGVQLLREDLRSKVHIGVDVENNDALIRLLNNVRPDVVINCIGLVKQLSEAKNPLVALPINAMLPHRLSGICALIGARVIHPSTDCVFDGNKGNYKESDRPDADDLYGRSKLLGEVDYPNAITLRTSIIGHELSGTRSLINWFLCQENQTKGYKSAIFSGLPTVELARVIRDYVIPFPELRGLYHVSAEPINKYELLSLVAEIYGKTINIQQDDSVVIDRSLDSTRFRQATGFNPAPWPDLLRKMHQFH